MERMPKPPNPEAYYSTVLHGRSQISNTAARAVYFEQTEPRGEEPKHTRVIHTRKAKAICAAMIYKITRDVTVNLMIGVQHGTRIPHPDQKFPDGSPLQPLAMAANPATPDL
jgi:hypothetical protein